MACVISFYYFKQKQEHYTDNIDYAKYSDDITKMNKTPIDKIFNVMCADDIIYVIDMAHKNNKKIIARGESHSMGGQTITENGYIIDTKFMNHILKLNNKKKSVIVEPGVTWYQLINYLNIYGYSPKILQSYASFSIGGSVSVNIHGITSDNCLYHAIQELEIVNYKGKLITCNRQQNKELFSLIIGGYGLFGIITKVELNIVNNTKLQMQTEYLDINNFTQRYEELINDNNNNNNNIQIKIARINITNMHDIDLYTFKNKDDKQIISQLDDKPKEMSKIAQLLYKWILPNQKIQKIRFNMERKLGKPFDINEDDDITRNSFLYESATPLAKLYSPLVNTNKTHILQEYFIPNNKFVDWMLYLKEIFIYEKSLFNTSNNSNNDINLLNITIRYVLKDSTTFLNYANKDMYAFVLYYRINCDKVADDKLKSIHNLLLNKTIEYNGSFYLPYRHHYTYDQLFKIYPQISNFFEYKIKYDPSETFHNLWYDYYKVNKITPIFNKQLVNIQIKKTLKYSDNISNIKKTSYNTILSNQYKSNKLKQFLTYVFKVLDDDELYNHILLINNINPNIDDLTMYQKIKEYAETKYSNISLSYELFKLTRYQKEIVTKYVKELLLKIGINYPFTNYVNFGDSGKYLAVLKEELDINGKIYTVNDYYDYFEDYLMVGQFIKYDFKEMPAMPFENNSVGLVTCLIGLHHFELDKLIKFLTMIYDFLKPNGLFIIKEHNGYDDLIPLLNCAHNIFNATTGISIDTEEKEVRYFRPIAEWRKIMEACGFIDMQIYTLQENDPTENFYMCFIKPVCHNNNNNNNNNNTIPFGLKSKCHKNLDYKRSLSQTYLTTPEWFSVDIIKEYGNYLEHTPWYDFPYISTIGKYWKIWYNSIIASNEISISYIFMNSIIGLLISIFFIQLSALSFIPSLFYHLPGNDEIGNIKMIVYNNNKVKKFKHIDKRIKLIDSENKYYIIEVPRYKQFMDILIKLIMNNIDIVEIAGQTEIQMRVSNNNNNNNNIHDIEGIKYLYDYKIVNVNDSIISVKLDKIKNVINNGIIIKHIYDY